MEISGVIHSKKSQKGMSRTGKEGGSGGLKEGLERLSVAFVACGCDLGVQGEASPGPAQG